MKRLVLVLGVLAAAVSLAILVAPGAGIANGDDNDQGDGSTYGGLHAVAVFFREHRVSHSARAAGLFGHGYTEPFAGL